MKKVIINFKNKTVSVFNNKKQTWKHISFSEAGIPDEIQNSDMFIESDCDAWFAEKFEDEIELEYIE